jgi:hypothetical protein
VAPAAAAAASVMGKVKSALVNLDDDDEEDGWS